MLVLFLRIGNAIGRSLHLSCKTAGDRPKQTHQTLKQVRRAARTLDSSSPYYGNLIGDRPVWGWSYGVARINLKTMKNIWLLRCHSIKYALQISTNSYGSVRSIGFVIFLPL